MFASQVKTYTEAIRNGEMPCVESALKSLALIENTRAVDLAFRTYIEEMAALQLPTVDDKTLNGHHFTTLQMALQIFFNKAIMDENHEFKAKLNVNITYFYNAVF